MKWVTRSRPKIDRIACPWLIARFIDAKPEFLYVPTEEALRVAQESDAMPYDIPGVALTTTANYAVSTCSSGPTG